MSRGQAETPPPLSTGDCISIAKRRRTWKQFTFLVTFFLIPRVEKELGLLAFPKTEKAAARSALQRQARAL